MGDLIARSAEWADPDQEIIERLTTETALAGWRPALARLESDFPFFARRMRDLGLANWHLLLLRPRRHRALDIGCGFGSLALGLSEYFESVAGLDALRSRVTYAGLRASEDGRPARFAVGSALDLPVESASVDLVTMNGVLEWAALFHNPQQRNSLGGLPSEPESLQRRVLSEALRVLAPGGTLAVAIENRYAMETLVGMPDTHTGLRLVPALPRILANLISRAAKRGPFRTYLYDAPGYRRLGLSAGFGEVRVLDLISSYNDYDYIVETGDTASYRLLWRRNAVRTFHSAAGVVRRSLARVWPGKLDTFAYAYLLLMGDKVTTGLDADHPIWTHTRKYGFDAGSHRLAVKGSRTGSLALLTHDGERVESVIELGVDLGSEATAFGCVPEHIVESLELRAATSTAWSIDGIAVRAHRLASPAT